MRMLRMSGGMLLLWLVFLTSPAYPWGLLSTPISPIG